MNSRDKGARGEREFAAFLRERGVAARRGQQFSGSPDSPDVVIESGLSVAVHFEVKRTERLSLYPAMEQAKKDSSHNQIPIVAHKKNRKQWLAVLSADDLIALLKAAK